MTQTFKAFRKSDDARVDLTLEPDEARINWSVSIAGEHVADITINPSVTREFEIRQRLTMALSRAGYAVLP